MTKRISSPEKIISGGAGGSSRGAGGSGSRGGRRRSRGAGGCSRGTGRSGSRGGRRRRSRWWYEAAGAVLVALLAVALSSGTFPGIYSSSSRGGCGCSSARKYTGMVEDCCCDYETVDAINEEVLHPILQDLVKLPFFRYFKALEIYAAVRGVILQVDQTSVEECITERQQEQ